MKSEELLQHLHSNPFVLAPMAGITDCAFRTFMRELGCGIVISELVSAHGLEYNSQKTHKLMGFEEIQRPVGIQIFGDTPDVLARGAQIVEQTGADFVDLNFGCPVPKVVKKGGGSAILKDLPRVAETFREVKKATKLPVTVKIRTGWDETSKNAEEVTKIAYEEGLTWVAIHGRTRSAGYSGQADWDYLKQTKALSKIPIIGNGDIHNAYQANQRLEQSQCDAVMIGRGCLKNPFIFSQSLELYKKRDLAGVQTLTPREINFAELFIQLHRALERHADEKITLLQLRKFASWFSSGYAGASQFRKNIFLAENLHELLGVIGDYFSQLKISNQADTSTEAFLMGGHG